MVGIQRIGSWGNERAFFRVWCFCWWYIFLVLVNMGVRMRSESEIREKLNGDQSVTFKNALKWVLSDSEPG